MATSVPPGGSLAALQSPSGDRGASVPPGAVVLQVACVFRPEIGTWTPLYHPTNGEAFSLILTSPAWKSERIPNSISVTFSGAKDWNLVRRPANVVPLMPPERNQRRGQKQRNKT